MSPPKPPLPDLPSLCLAITEHAPLPMATVEGATRIVRYANPAFCLLLERSVEQLVGRPLDQLLSDGDECLKLVDRVYRTKTSASHTEREPSKPHPVFRSYTIWPVLEDQGLVGVMIQITETARAHRDTVAMNEALLLGSLRQHELTEAAEAANARLQLEILERQQAEEALRSNEWRLRYATESARLTYVEVDFARGTVRRADNFAAVMGSNPPPEQEADVAIATRQLLARVVPQDRWRVEAAVNEFLEAGPSGKVEYRVVGDDGIERWIETRWSLERGPDGQPLKSFATHLDITERKLVEEAFRESEERYRTLFDTIDESFCTIEVFFDENGKAYDHIFLEANRAFAKHTGIENPVGKKGSELLPNLERHWDELYGRVATTGISERVEQASGSQNRWYDAFVSRVGGAGSRKVAILFTDVTQRRRTAEKLAEKARLLDLSNDAIIVLDQEENITSWNQGAEKLFGWAGEEVMGRPLHFLLQTEFLQPKVEIIAQLYRDKDYMGEVIQTTRDGRRVSSLCRWVLDMDTQSVLTSYTDITARKAAELEMTEARDAAERANSSKDMFLAALSHELRTPLGPVLLLASEAAADPNMPPEARETFTTIVKNIKLEARLIDDLLDVTRIAHAKLSLDFRIVDVHVVLREAIETVKSEIEDKHLHLKLELQAKNPLMMGDSLRLQQIFWNVLRNAVKFSDDGQEIVVKTSVLNDEFLSIVIADHGIGMTDDEMGRLFASFAQGDHASQGGSHRFGGLGLGLSISRTLTEMHSGTIRAESPGVHQGATFSIEFPLDKEARKKASVLPFQKDPKSVSPFEVRKGASPSRILLVEDHVSTRTALEHLLKRRHYTVVSAGSLAEARAAASGTAFDLLISDLGLPDGSGLDLMADLNARFGLKGIALTGYGYDEDVARTRQAGFLAHLIKPVSIQALETALATITVEAK